MEPTYGKAITPNVDRGGKKYGKYDYESMYNYKDFIRYMELPQNRSEYKIFYGWLSRKSYCIGKPSRKINWSDEQNNLKEIA